MYNKSYFWAVAISMTLVCLAQGKGNLGGVDVGIGYARLSLEGNNNNDILNGWGPAFRFWFKDVSTQGGLQPFLGLHYTRYPGDNDKDAIWDVSMFTTDVGLLWHRRLGNSGLFFEPSVTGGAAITTYTRRGDFLASYYLGEDDTAVGWVVRPGALLGYQRDRWAGGIEISYGFLNVDFADKVRFVFDKELYSSEEVSGTHGELYIGLFGRFLL